MYKHFRTKEEMILAVLRLRDERFRNWFCRRIEEIAETPEDRLLAVFDALQEWFKSSEFKGCMFIKAVSEFQDPKDPIHIQSATHKRMLLEFVQGLAAQAGVADSGALARQLMLLKEGAIVTAVMQGNAEAATEAKVAARILVTAAARC
jgi:AcrR family transcriptional regulator